MVHEASGMEVAKGKRLILNRDILLKLNVRGIASSVEEGTAELEQRARSVLGASAGREHKAQYRGQKVMGELLQRSAIRACDEAAGAQ